ncbi:MAG: RAMP superfamily CRISPR-associated protein [SAR324 cluster bacterium]|jgi:hypothetical protein|nr:RAMP superfamily CRISPR-associated protein [SAR324 cluster bacterium]MDP7335487.1 RAMP superfamily CRISPR-associated protein [SAR324 cluster bacterium]|tara:strand:- start:560 stop:2095 length:1536 start_codon:yes stop_codon:yes gene_type:complete
MTASHNRHVHPLQLEVLTPVAIGNGQNLDPLHYTIAKDGSGKDELHFIDLDHWMDAHADDKSLHRALEGNPLEFRSYLHQNLKDSSELKKYSIFRRRVEDAGLVRRFQEKITEVNSKNRLQVFEVAKNPVTGRLVIPGSSLKGALVTPVIDHFERTHQLGWKRHADSPFGFRNVMEETFGKITESTFKGLKVSDAECPDDVGVVVTAVEKRKSREGDGTPKLDSEAIGSKRIDGSPTLLGCLLTLGFDENSSGVLSVPKLKSKLDWTEICRIVTKFYQDRFIEEWDWFYNQQWMGRTRERLESVRQRIKTLRPEDGIMLIRVGHYSHSRCVTIDNSKPWAKSGKDGMLQGPNTTRTLANGLLPFGWILLSECSWEVWEARRSVLDEERYKAQELQEKQRLEQKQQKTAALQAEREQKEKELQAAKAEAAKPAGERLIKEVEKLQDWGQIMQFASSKLEALDPKEYVPELGEALRNQVIIKGVTKKGIKKDPQLGEKRMSKMDEWLNRFESS